MPRSGSTLKGFFVRALAWLLVALALWYPLRQWLVLAPAWLAGEVMQAAFPRWVTGVQFEGSAQVLLTALRVWSPDNRPGELAPEVNGLVYAYGAPLLAALLLAARTPRWWWKLPAGLVALVPFQAWGICFTWLLQVAVTAGDQTRGQTHFGPLAANLIAVGYQFGFLIMPTLAPVLLWLAFDRRVLAGAMIEGALAGGD
ncbi:exosortase H-associated membrane protein [Caenimonas terrae]|uniref:Exosortase H-associated membrane protein n=1 Tax=Caenimonas terrae TaxID=696074 RepID=A0ABW0NAJ8_9BURK